MPRSSSIGRDAEAVGLLDERYFLYTEDVDFCAAIRARGRNILFTPAATITHLRGRSRATAPTAMNAAYRQSQIAFYDKHHPRWARSSAYLREGAAAALERSDLRGFRLTRSRSFTLGGATSKSTAKPAQATAEATSAQVAVR